MTYYNAPLKDITKHRKQFLYEESKPKVSITLYKIYIATKILELSSETRYIAFVLFYRYLFQYQLLYSSSSNGKASKDVGHKQSGCKVDDTPESISDPQKHLGKVAVATLFLGCKLANENRRIRDVINMYHILRFGHEPEGFDHQQQIIAIESTPPPINESYWDFKEEIVKVEHHLLRVLNFDVYDLSMTPYRIVISIIEIIIGVFESTGYENDQNLQNCGETQNKLLFKQILQATWKHINDGLFHIDLLTIKNSEFASGALQLAVETIQSDCDLTKNINKLSWWEWVDVSVDQLDRARSIILKSKQQRLRNNNR